MKKLNFFSKVAVAAVLVASAFVMVGCKPGVTPTVSVDMSTVVDINESDPLNATWQSSLGETFYISSGDDIFYNDSYEGDNLKIRKISETSGYIYMQYTAVYDWDKGQEEEPEDSSSWLYTWGYWYPLNEALIGKWYAVYYSDLDVPEDGVKKVKFSGAFKAKEKNACNSLEEAANEFTVENGYFGNSSECSEALPC